MKQKVEVGLEEGDYLRFNDKVWEVMDITWSSIALEPQVGEWRSFDREELEELISYSGDFHLIRKDYLDIIEH